MNIKTYLSKLLKFEKDNKKKCEIRAYRNNLTSGQLFYKIDDIASNDNFLEFS